MVDAGPRSAEPAQTELFLHVFDVLLVIIRIVIRAVTLAHGLVRVDSEMG